MIIIVLSLRIFTYFFVEIAMQSSLQSCPIDTRNPVARPFRILPCCNCWDREGDKGTVTIFFVVISVPLTADTVDPGLVLEMLEQILACLRII